MNQHFEKYQVFLTVAAQKLLARLQTADMLFRNKGRGLVGLLIQVILPCSVRTRGSDARAIVSFVRFCWRLGRRSGVKYLVLYLKAAQVLLQQSCGGYRLSSTRPLKAAVRRTRGGLPAIIPKAYRAKIRQMSRRDIRLWMTLLGLYRVLGFKGSVSFDTITKPGKVLSGETIVGFQRFLHDRFYVEASARYGRNPMLDQALTRNKKGK